MPLHRCKDARREILICVLQTFLTPSQLVSAMGRSSRIFPNCSWHPCFRWATNKICPLFFFFNVLRRIAPTAHNQKVDTPLSPPIKAAQRCRNLTATPFCPCVFYTDAGLKSVDATTAPVKTFWDPIKCVSPRTCCQQYSPLMEQLQNSLEQHLTRITLWQSPQPPLQMEGRVGAAAYSEQHLPPPAPTPLIRSDTLLSSTCPHEAHVTISYHEAGFLKRAPFHFLFHLSKYEKKRKSWSFSCRIWFFFSLVQ